MEVIFVSSLIYYRSVWCSMCRETYGCCESARDGTRASGRTGGDGLPLAAPVAGWLARDPHPAG